jgi:hypothetical protein
MPLRHPPIAHLSASRDTCSIPLGRSPIAYLSCVQGLTCSMFNRLRRIVFDVFIIIGHICPVTCGFCDPSADQNDQRTPTVNDALKHGAPTRTFPDTKQPRYVRACAYACVYAWYICCGQCSGVVCADVCVCAPHRAGRMYVLSAIWIQVTSTSDLRSEECPPPPLTSNAHDLCRPIHQCT